MSNPNEIPCHITDGPQEPDDVNPAVDYERDQEPCDRHAQEALDDKRAAIDDLSDRADSAFLDWFMNPQIPGYFDAEVVRYLNSAFLAGAKFGVNEFAREAGLTKNETSK